MAIKYTKHGEKRINQRGFLPKDIELIRQYGTRLRDRSAEVYFLRNKDVDERIKDLKRQIQCLDRVRGCKAAYTQDEALITAHHTTRKHEKKLLRRVD
jgi:hypothetical protein